MARGLAIALRRGGISDPVSNGYTRTARGAVANLPFIPSIQTGPGASNVKKTIVSNAAGVLQLTCSRQALTITDDATHTECGLQLGTAIMFIGERGASGGPEVWTTQGFLAGVQLATNVQAFKLAIAPAGRLRAWGTNFAVYDGTPGDAAIGNGWAWQSSDQNANGNGGVGNYSQIVACLDNALHFANCPALGSVSVTIGNEAPIVVNLDAAGAGALDVDARRFPLAVSYVIQTAAAVVVASLSIPASYGGDVIGLR